MIKRLLCLLPLLSGAVTVQSTPAYSATIRYTEYGIPHITAGAYGDLGFGQGYAMAKDNLCTLANGYVTVRGERSLFFGKDGKAFGVDAEPLRVPGANVYSTADVNLDSDVYFRSVSPALDGLLAQPYPQGPRTEIFEILRGYVAGYNKAVGEGTTDTRCAGKPWLRPITERDAWLFVYARMLYGGLGQAAAGIAQADLTRGTGTAPTPDEVAAWARRFQSERQIGSNAVAAGGERSAGGRGLLLGNPHFPWHDGLRFWQSQLTLPGRLNVSGGSLLGLPGVQIGFNDKVAWSHTVSASYPFVIYDLKTIPGSPTSYLVDGQVEQMTSRDIVVPTSTGPVTRKVWSTRYGPVTTKITSLPTPWAGLLAFTIADANLTNLRAANAWFDMDHAGSVAELDQALRRNQGIPWVNTIAADSAGNAYFSDIQVVQNISDAQLDACVTVLGQLASTLSYVAILDGTRTFCLPGTDPDAIVPGIFGPAQQPAITNRTWVANSNDSPWLLNDTTRLTAYPRHQVKTGVQQDLRTRYGLTAIPALGTGLTRASMEQLVFANRFYAWELVRADVLELCRTMPLGHAPSRVGPIAVANSCDVLEAWDGRLENGSRGAVLFSRFWEHMTVGASLPEQLTKNPWATPFSAADPVATPRGVSINLGHQIDFGNALADLREAGIAYDAPWGEHHYVTRGGTRIPIHGGGGHNGGVYNVTIADWQGGYKEMNHGSSYLQAVAFDGDGCPDARGFLAYSQSENPNSPHHADQTREFSAKRWITQRFCEADILASPALRTITVTSP
ncbi:penicillin acylase family protein [Nonomuraea soli]|uniref:Acyl-homoserine-lactone acylase n=1 Tax=Nonomuraea soli TaxID=1032476 RepID=A0A7W0CS66_9ACTN|nr:penicillin acylase family protein [Nonomuraea soli]MBA2896292.1 acyl-homoserine-lactone acylase [Nonomuraea soli]